MSPTTTTGRVQTRVQVRGKGQAEFFFEMVGGSMPLPRVGERVKFENGYAVVESVTWEPRKTEMLVVAECVIEEVER